MKTSIVLLSLNVIAVGAITCGQDRPTLRKPTSTERQGRKWKEGLTDLSKRGTLHDQSQDVRGDSGKWNDAPQLIHAPPLKNRPKNVRLDDWFDHLHAKQGQLKHGGDVSLLFRTRQLDDNDRVWVESIERRDNRFTIVVSEAIWQGRYSKTFTYYPVFGVNLGRLEAGKYEAKVIIKPRTFRRFDGSGRSTERDPTTNRRKPNWPKDERDAKKKPVELRTSFVVGSANQQEKNR